MKRVLVIQLARIGDILQAMPMMLALKKKWPACHIAMLVNRKFSDACRIMPCVDEILDVDLNTIGSYLFGEHASLEEAYDYIKTLYAEIRRKEFSPVINITPHYIGIISAFLSGTDIAHKHSESKWDLYFRSITHSWNLLPYHLSDLHKNIAGVPPSQEGTHLSISDESRQWADSFLYSHGIGKKEYLIGIHPGASTPEKQWPAEYFARLCQLLLEDHNVRIIVVGNSPVFDFTSVLGSRCIDATEKTNISQLAALLQKLHIFITNDTGPMHIAAAAGTPIISIHIGKESCFTTGPYTKKGYAIQPVLACHPCRYPERCTNFQCKSQVEPELVHALALFIKHGADSELRNSIISFSDKAVVYTSGFDPAGFFDYYPITHKSIDINDIVRRMMRLVWKKTLDHQAEGPLSDISPAHIDSFVKTLGKFYVINGDDLIRQHSEIDRELCKMIYLSARGIDVCKDILSHANDALRRYRHLKHRAEENEKIEKTITAIGERIPCLRPLTHMFFFEKDENCSDDFKNAAQDALNSYTMLHVRSKMLRSMVTDFVACYQKNGWKSYTITVKRSAYG